MDRNKSNERAIIAAAKKLVQNKKAILAYSNGEVSKQELNAKGIKLSLPL